MTGPFAQRCGIVLLMSATLFAGCGHKDDRGHDHSAESTSGASFKAGKGVSVTDETRKILGLKVANVIEEKLPHEIQFTAHIYDAAPNHPTRTLLASGLVAPTQAALIRAGMAVQFVTPSGGTTEGTVEKVHSSLASGDAEIEVAFPDSGAVKSGDFVRGVITLPRTNAAMVIPLSALLRTSEGTFVYVVNGPAYFRTAVKVGATNNDRVEITDGLLAGDAVVITPVQTLWLIELRAVKGGGHCH